MKVWDNTETALNYIRENKENYAVFSFDIFDTLLHRHVHPDAVLHGLSCWINDFLISKNITPVTDIVAARHIAYSHVANKNADIGFDHEVSYDDFCAEWIETVVGKKHEIGKDDLKEIVLALQEKELELETRCLYPNKKVRYLIEELVANKKKIILVSDMYLPQRIINKLLEINGYPISYFYNIYVSSEVKFLKKTGKLFDFVLNDIKTESSYLIHVGDNEESDGKQAFAKGIHPVLIKDKKVFSEIKKRKIDYEFYKKYKAWSGILVHRYAQSKQRIVSNGDFLSDNFLAPILCGFIHRLIERLEEENIKVVYFCAREGVILKSIFDTMVNKISPNLGVSSKYLYASRLSTFLAASSNGITWKGIQDAIKNTNKYTLMNIMKPYGVDPLVLKETATKCGIYSIEETLPPHFETWPPFIRFINDKKLNEIVSKKGVLYYSQFKKYLDQIGFFETSKIALVDVGWSGQIQDNIYEALSDIDDKPTIHGFYLGTRVLAHERATRKSLYEWIICDESHQEWYSYPTFESVFLIETLTRAPHGTVIGYQEEPNGVIIPVLKSDSTTSRHREIQDEALICAHQFSAIEYAHYYAELVNILNLGASENLPYARLCLDRIIRFPSLKLYERYKIIGNVSDLGSDETLTLASDLSKGIRNLKRILGQSLWSYGVLANYNVLMRILYSVRRASKIAKQQPLIPRQPNKLAIGVIIPKIPEPKSVILKNDESDEIKKYVNLIQYKAKEYFSNCNSENKSDAVDLKHIILSYVSFRITNIISALKRSPKFYNGGISFLMLLNATLKERISEKSRLVLIINKLRMGK